MKVPPFSLDKQLTEISSELDIAVLRVLNGGHYIGGKEVEAFEASFAKTIEVPYAVGCNSGTDALILALRALDVGKGDEVITPSFSFFATAEAITAVGAKPVFVDVSPSNYLIELKDLEKSITSATKAILPVHLFGCPVEMDSLMDFAKEYDLKVIEDCAQAAGAQWKGRPVGSWGDIGCFSFFPTKNLGAAGDAGAVTTSDQSLAKKMRELAVHGMPRRYVHTQLGYNSRLDAIQAAVLNVKLPKLLGWVAKRNDIADRYLDSLQDLPYLRLPNYKKEDLTVNSWNQFVVQVKSIDGQVKKSNTKTIYSEINLDEFSSKSYNRDSLKSKLQNEDINTIIYYPIPIHLQPAYKELSYEIGSLPVTESLCCEVLSLPIFPELTIEEQLQVISVLRKLVFT